jgi:hypothetical protein
VSLAYENDDAIRQWSATKRHCAACWIDHRTAEREQLTGLQSHHILKRSRIRCDRPWNLLRLCERCHRLAEGECIRVDGIVWPVLTEGHCLWFKLEADRAEWKPAKLAKLKEPGRLAGLLPVPTLILKERAKHRPFVDWRDLGSIA